MKVYIVTQEEWSGSYEDSGTTELIKAFIVEEKAKKYCEQHNTAFGFIKNRTEEHRYYDYVELEVE